MVSTSARYDVSAAPVEAIVSMREEYRREMACQIVHDSWHARGFTTSYLLRLDTHVVGYGSVGGAPRDAKHTIKEFYVRPACRRSALSLFRGLIAASGAQRIEAQTNDPFLLLMLFDFAADVSSQTILFADAVRTEHTSHGSAFRPLSEVERQRVFPHTREPVGEYGLECDGEIVATGGLTFHYNPPYADLYMEVSGPHQRSGFGTYLVQELKRACREMGHVPAARCDESNHASRRTLERAGMYPCGRIVQGTIAA